MKKLYLKMISAVLALMLLVSLVPINASAAAAGSKAGIISVSWGSLNVRSSASTSSQILTTVPKDSYVTLISRSGSWWRVEYAENKFGYCSASYITELPGTYAVYSIATLNVRSGPGTTYGVVGWLDKGEYAVVLSTTGKWNKVLYNGNKIGYASGNYLTTGASGSTYKAISLNVPSFKQTDSRWAYVEVGTSGKTISSIGCATTAIAMMESYRTGTTIYPDAMEAKLKYTAGGSVYWPSNYTSYTGSDYLSVVYNKLQSGKPVLVGLTNSYGGQHWVVVTGFKGGSYLTPSAFTINDPGSNSITTLQQIINSYPNFYKIMYY